MMSERMTPIGLLNTWIEEEQAKLENLTVTADGLPPGAFRDALEYPIGIHRDRLAILFGLLEGELAE